MKRGDAGLLVFAHAPHDVHRVAVSRVHVGDDGDVHRFDRARDPPHGPVDSRSDGAGRTVGFVPDGKLTFDKLSSVFASGNATRDDAPNHIRVQRRVPRGGQPRRMGEGGQPDAPAAQRQQQVPRQGQARRRRPRALSDPDGR